MNASAKQYYPALTGLRAAAAYLVYAHHTLSQAPANASLLDLLSQEGHMGVSLFFVLSGFLIGTRYQTAFEQNGLGYWKEFAVQRFARIYPAYLGCTLLLLLYKAKPLGVWVLNLLLLQGYFDEVAFTGIGIGWSLTAEITFYAAAPLVLRYWNRLGLFGWTGLTFLLGVVLVGLGQLPLTYDFMPDLNFMVRATFFGRCLEFYLGLWAARRFMVQPVSPFSVTITWGWRTYLGLAGVISTMLLMAYVRGATPRDLTTEQLWWFNGLNNLLLPVFIVLLILGLSREKTVVQRVLGSRIGIELGQGSYLFYLLHYKLGISLLYAQVWPSRLGIWLLMVVLSVAGYHLLEAPAQRWCLQKFKFRPKLPTDSANLGS